MGDLVADVVELHRSLPVVAALLQYQRQPVLEDQAREPAVVGVVQRPRPAMPPVLMRLPVADGVPARLLDVRLQLAPREHEERLVVDPPLLIDGVRRRFVASSVLGVAQASQLEIDLLVRRRHRLKVAHRRMRLNHSRVTASLSHRRSARETSQLGRAKFSAVSMM